MVVDRVAAEAGPPPVSPTIRFPTAVVMIPLDTTFQLKEEMRIRGLVGRRNEENGGDGRGNWNGRYNHLANNVVL